MKTIVFATNNAHKLDELRQLTQGMLHIRSLAEIGCTDDIAETASTLEGNALIKARWIKQHYGYDCFADDTGLEVEALGGEPGVMSARYAGPGHDSEANMKLLLKNMEGKENRAARFRTVIALIEGNTETLISGTVEGHIATEPQGDSGFGYDPVFVPSGFQSTFAQMTAAEKNSISHRGRAVAKLIEHWSKK